jgi:hypothetical protein
MTFAADRISARGTSSLVQERAVTGDCAALHPGYKGSVD